MVASITRSWLPYTTNKRLKVDIWQIGLTNIILQLAVFVGYGYSIYRSGSYLEWKDVDGAVAPYAVAPTYRSVSHSYCNDYSFFYDMDTFVYDAPSCELENIYTINKKGQNYLSFTTVYVEWQEYGWPCADSNSSMAQQARADCDAGTERVDATGQCHCHSTRSVFPIDVEQSSVAFVSLYNVHEFQGKSWSGSSMSVRSAHDIRVRLPDGSTMLHRAGSELRVPLSTLLAYAGVASLDAPNLHVGGDARDASHLPSYRNTGVDLQVNMHYYNRDEESSEAVLWDEDVDVRVEVQLASKAWISVGPSSSYIVPPVGSVGNRTYRRSTRYPQDIEVRFVPRGRVHAFGIMAFFDAIVSVVVLAGMTKTLMDFIVFYLLPNGISLVLRNKRDEHATRDAAFAELGLKAAVSVSQFCELDRRETGRLNIADLAAVYAKVPDVDDLQAATIAKAVLAVGERGKGGANEVSTRSSTSWRSTNKARTDGLSFTEFMSITAGDAITFDDYVKLVKHAAGDVKDEEIQVACEAYKEVEEEEIAADQLDTAPVDDPSMRTRAANLVSSLAGRVHLKPSVASAGTSTAKGQPGLAPHAPGRPNGALSEALGRSSTQVEWPADTSA